MTTPRTASNSDARKRLAESATAPTRVLTGDEREIERAILARLEAKSDHTYQWPRWAAAQEAAQAAGDILAARIEQARAEGAAEVVARVEALHVPVPALAYSDDCLSPDEHEWMEADDGTNLCCDCPNDGLRVCGECRDDSGGLYVDWPCQTAAALRGDA